MGLAKYYRREKQVVIHRSDIEKIHDYARQNCSPRDFLLIRLPMKIGLRTGEIATFRIEKINFNDRSFCVLDSKKKVLFPLPLDVLTLQLIQDLIGFRTQGYVFRQETSWKHVKGDKPLTLQTLWTRIHKIAKEAGVSNFNPRKLREYFAADWAHVQKKSLVALQQIMRHTSLETTSIYISKLVFWEDLQSEFDGVKNEPFREFERAPEGTQTPITFQKPTSKTLCNDCRHEPICKFKSQVALSPWASGCKFSTLKITQILK